MNQALRTNFKLNLIIRYFTVTSLLVSTPSRMPHLSGHAWLGPHAVPFPGPGMRVKVAKHKDSDWSHGSDHRPFHCHPPEARRPNTAPSRGKVRPHLPRGPTVPSRPGNAPLWSPEQCARPKMLDRSNPVIDGSFLPTRRTFLYLDKSRKAAFHFTAGCDAATGTPRGPLHFHEATEVGSGSPIPPATVESWANPGCRVRLI